jgi:hypothetical protein
MPTSMNIPTIVELRRLPLRAMVAYAVQSARRVFDELRGLLPERALREAMDVAERVAYTRESVALTSVTTALVHVSEGLDSAQTARAQIGALVFTSTLMVAYAALDAETEMGDQEYCVSQAARSAANAASRSARIMGNLEEMAPEAIAAARRDYQELLRDVEGRKREEKGEEKGTGHRSI